MSHDVVLVANGDLRLSANQTCWPAQAEFEGQLVTALEARGRRTVRAHPYDETKKHGFIDSQKHGLEVFRNIAPAAPLIVVEAVWQYSQHLLPGLLSHRGPILTLANWSGQWPGLVGLLNLNASLTKAGVPYSTLWGIDFYDPTLSGGLRQWLETGKVVHDTSHVIDASRLTLPREAASVGKQVAHDFRHNKAILGVFDEGCMGMYNAIIPDEMLHPMGIFKERLSQSTLYAAMCRVRDEEAAAVHQWLDEQGMTFHTGSDEATELTDGQIRQQAKMYVAAVRMADEFGCDAIGIQYQQGLKDLTPASDLVEGILNNVHRPPVRSEDGGRVLYEGQALPHFNEVDECAGLDALATNWLWTKLGFDPETTLHDVRYGEPYVVNGTEEFVWVFEISGSVPPQHLEGGYRGATSERQPPMYFPKGGGTIKGISKPGEVVWSRIFVSQGMLMADLGRARAIALPKEETERRWSITTPQWPMMHTVLYGISRDQMMARHQSNHIQVAYAPDAESANRALAAKLAAFRGMGIKVHVCGTNHGLA